MKKEDAIIKIKETGKLQLFMKIIESGNYDALYEMFGKTVYDLFTPLSHKKKDIKKLMEEQNYGLIYQKYGSLEKMFIKNFRRASKEEIKQLIKEKKYLELENAYGEGKIKEVQFQAYKDDIEYETGSKFKAKTLSSGKKTVHNLKEAVKGMAIFATTTGIILAGKVGDYIDTTYKQSLQENAELIQEYDEEIAEYADYIQDLQLDSDIEVVMKVMDDMWKEIEYGNPTKDISSLGRLAFTEDEKVGVCRNIADDFSSRMNAINPEYNARNIAVMMDSNYYSHESLANIDRTIRETNETVVEGNENNDELTETQEKIGDFMDNLHVEKYTGNHMVSIFEPIGKNYTLVVDATNPSIGMIANGKIYMFSTEEGKGLEYKPFGQMLTVQNYDSEDIWQEFTGSFVSYSSQKELMEIEEQWNTQKQNEALAKVRTLDNSQNDNSNLNL